MSSTISEKVIKIVAKELDIEEADVKLESTFVDDLGADSLASVEVTWLLRKSSTLISQMKMLKKLTLFSKWLITLLKQVNKLIHNAA